MTKTYILYLLFGFLILASSFVFGQDDGNGNNSAFNYKAELNRMVKIPNSPEAAAFNSYGNIPVNLNKGMPEISIPIHIIKGKVMDIPISLVYDPLNLKVEDIATSAGLGWNLNAGGRITRNTNGLPDDYISSDYKTPYNDGPTANAFSNYKDKISSSNGFQTDNTLFNFFKFLEEIEKNKIDVLPDTYNLNAPGLNTTIVIYENQVYSLDNPRMSINIVRSGQSISTWEITSNGIKYTFSNPEIIDFNNDDDLNDSGALIRIYNSSWVLTKIETPNMRDVYEFSYADFGFWQTPKPISAASQVSETSVSSVGTLSWLNATPVYSTGMQKIRQKFLTRIKYNGNSVININLGTRSDLSIPSKISSISVSDNSGLKVSGYDFFYSYFGIPNTANPSNSDEKDLRLKLDGIGISGPGLVLNNDLNSFEKKFKFYYHNPEEVPARDSKSQDLFGYYNGKVNNTLIPSLNVYGNTFSGANRSFDYEYAITGILNQIEYPLGGHTDFEYEQAEKIEYEIRPNTNIYLNLNTNLQAPNDFYNQNRFNATYFNECVNNGCCPSPSPPESNKIVNNQTDPQPFKSPGAYNSKTFEVSESALYTINSGIQGVFLPYDTSEEYLRSFIIELSDCQPLSYTEVFAACESGVNVIWDYHSATDSTINLDATKCYQAVILNAMIKVTFSNGSQEIGNISGEIGFNIKISKTQDDPFVSEVIKYPSYRIKEITDYYASNSEAIKKQYSYGNVIQNVDPKNHDLTNESYYDNNSSEIKLKPRLIRYSNPIIGSEPILSYSGVSESLVDIETGEIKGNKTYSFVTSGIKGSKPNFSPPYASSYYSNDSKGKMSSFKVTNENAELVVQENNVYFNDIFNDINRIGFTSTNDASKNLHVIATSSNNPGWYYYIPYQNQGFLGLTTLSFPLACQNPSVNCFSGIKPTIGFQTVGISSRVSGLERQNKTSHFSTGDITTTTNYEFNEDYLPRKIHTNNSSDGLNTIEFNYNSDLDLPEIKSPFPENPVIVKNFKNSSLISTKKTVYKAITQNLRTKTLPDRISFSKGLNTLENRVIFKRYDNFGNLIELEREGSVSTSYIWGYQGQYIVAKIDNATISQIESLSSFGLDFQIQENLNASQEATLRNISNALVTTYSYKPLVGMTSQTDPRGYTTYYEYDNLNRLKYVKDNDGNILSKNKYNYRTNN